MDFLLQLIHLDVVLLLRLAHLVLVALLDVLDLCILIGQLGFKLVDFALGIIEFLDNLISLSFHRDQHQLQVIVIGNLVRIYLFFDEGALKSLLHEAEAGNDFLRVHHVPLVVRLASGVDELELIPTARFFLFYLTPQVFQGLLVGLSDLFSHDFAQNGVVSRHFRVNHLLLSLVELRLRLVQTVPDLLLFVGQLADFRDLLRNRRVETLASVFRSVEVELHLVELV